MQYSAWQLQILTAAQGRLDYNTEGLLLLTNSGEVARFMEHPSSDIHRKYMVKVYGFIQEYMLKELARGVVIEQVRYKPVRISLLSTKGKHSWLEITLFEGKVSVVLAVFSRD